MIEIFHISDLHFGKTETQNRKAKSLLEIIKREFTVASQSERYLLVTGDFTQRGNEEEYKLAYEALSPFEKRVLITPGNHDYAGNYFGTDYSKERAKYFDHSFAASLGIDHSFYEKKSVFVSLLQDLVMIGLNSCTKVGKEDKAQGEIGDSQLTDLREKIKLYKALPKIVFLHHIPNRDAEYPDYMTLKDWRKLMDVVAGKVDVLAFGHQGKVMQVDESGKSRILRAKNRRPMKVRHIDTDRKRMWVLDADSSVGKHSLAYYRVACEGNQLNKPELHEVFGDMR